MIGITVGGTFAQRELSLGFVHGRSALPADSPVSCSFRTWFRSMRTRSLVLPLFLMALGCSRKPATIAFIPDQTDDLWEPAHIAAANVARTKGLDVYWNGPTRMYDSQRQIFLLDHAIEKGTQGILLAPAQPLALVSPVQRAVSRGLPVVVLGSPLPVPASGTLSYVLNDEEEEGRIAARHLGQRLRGKGDVVVLGLHPGVPSLYLRLRAFEDVLAAEFPRIKVVSVHMGSSDEAQAEQTARDVLRSEPHVNAILCLNYLATAGAFDALRDEQNRTVLLVGCDQRYDLLYYLSLGMIDALIAEDTYEMGKRGMEIATAGRRPDGAASVIKIKPLLITRENIYAPQFRRVLIHNWEPAP
jgi:ribose transport system substrate-binding protein